MWGFVIFCWTMEVEDVELSSGNRRFLSSLSLSVLGYHWVMDTRTLRDTETDLLLLHCSLFNSQSLCTLCWTLTQSILLGREDSYYPFLYSSDWSSFRDGAQDLIVLLIIYGLWLATCLVAARGGGVAGRRWHWTSDWIWIGHFMKMRRHHTRK